MSGETTSTWWPSGCEGAVDPGTHRFCPRGPLTDPSESTGSHAGEKHKTYRQRSEALEMKCFSGLVL